MMYGDTCTDYIFNPLTDYRKKIFQQIIARVENGGDMLDLGSGAVGDYWALGYINRIKSLVFADKTSALLEIIRSRVHHISPDILQKNFFDTIQFLEKINSPSLEFSCEFLARQMIEKIKDFKVVNFLMEPPADMLNRFDTVLAIESIECVSSEDDFLNSCAWAYSVLKNNGFFHAAILRYDSATPRIAHLISQGYEGALNPSADMIAENFKKAGFKVRDFEISPISDIPGYIELVHVIAEKSI